MNLPNKLTTIRIFCVPIMVVLFVLFYLSKTYDISCDVLLFSVKSGNMTYSLSLLQVIMTALFALASITDFVDGHIARKYKLVSDYGKLMDPLADKLLVNTTIICMLASMMYSLFNETTFIKILSVIAIFCSIIVITRDIFVDALRMQALKKNVVEAASIWGKLKTATLMPGIVFMLLGSSHYIVYIIGLLLMSLGGIFALIGGVKYYISLSKYIGD